MAAADRNWRQIDGQTHARQRMAIIVHKSQRIVDNPVVDTRSQAKFVRRGQKIIRRNQLALLAHHTQQDFMIAVATHANNWLRHQPKTILIQRLQDLVHH